MFLTWIRSCNPPDFSAGWVVSSLQLGPLGLPRAGALPGWVLGDTQHSQWLTQGHLQRATRTRLALARTWGRSVLPSSCPGVAAQQCRLALAFRCGHGHGAQVVSGFCLARLKMARLCAASAITLCFSPWPDALGQPKPHHPLPAGSAPAPHGLSGLLVSPVMGQRCTCLLLRA